MKNLLRTIMGRHVAWRLRRRSRPYVFSSGPILVVAPHADDETLGCGGLIALKRARGETVDVVFVSDSAGAPPVPGLGARRRVEALAALAALGVTGEQIHFLDAPDGQLNRLPVAESSRVVEALRSLIGQTQATEIFVPFLGGGSSEHDATVALVRTANFNHGQLWEYPVWAWWDPRRLTGQLDHPEQNYHLPLAGARQRKLVALACHASQVEPQTRGGKPALPPVLARLCTGPVEFFFQRQP